VSLLQPSLRHQSPERVEISGILGCDPGCQPDWSLRQRLSEPENPLQARKGDLDLLSGPTALLGLFGHQQDAQLSQIFFELFASVG
jgi:hypothetical protein